MIDRLLIWLLAERKPLTLYSLAAVAGLVMAWHLLGWDGIQGTSSYWETNHNDSLQGIAALRYYMNEPWSWPILEVASYGVPEGTNLILSDSIPLLAVPAKALSGVLPAGFHYFGYWMTFCFVMQAVVVVALFVEWRWRNYAAVIAGSVLGLTQTVMLSRFFHVALLAQFVLVVVVILGIRLGRAESARGLLSLMLVLVVAVFFIHLYLFAMVAVLATAFVVQAGLTKQLSWRSVGGWTGLAGAATLCLIVATGLANAASAGIGGLGHYSLNAIAPIAGNIDATGGQYEGFSYLGIGVVGLGIAAVVMARDHIRYALGRVWVPVLVASLMALYSLSPVVWIGESITFDLPWFGPLDWLGERFRSTGRFVWPLIYLSIAAILYAVVRNFKVRVAAALLLVASVVQVVDMAPLVSDVKRILQTAEEVYLDTEHWSEVIAAHDLVRIIPQECSVSMGVVALANRDVQRLTARAGVPVTAAAVARTSYDCDNLAFEEPMAHGELRIVWNAVDPEYRVADAECVSFDLGTACSAVQGGGGVELLAALDDSGS